MAIFSIGEYLFQEGELHEYLPRQNGLMVHEVDSLEPDYILNTDVEELTKHIAGKFTVNLPTLKVEDIYMNDEEVDIDVSQDPYRDIRDRSRPWSVKGTRLTFAIPCEGDQQFFKLSPLTCDFANPVKATITNDEILFIYETSDKDLNKVKQEFEQQKNKVLMHLSYAQKEVDEHNSQIENRARGRIQWRRNSLLENQTKVADLGYPRIKKESTPKTYSVSLNKKPKARKTSVKTESALPIEPALIMQEYEEILEIVSSCSHVMEQNPQSFVSMMEEDLRNQFLVQLNGHHPGGVTGETFNYEGKTDIMIKWEGRNIFIAECKFWGGKEILLETIDQLLGYTSWRDTKTSIFIFNKNKNLTKVLSQITDIVKLHPNFVKEVGDYKHETQFRYILHHKDDKDRELTLTVLVFDIPKNDN